VRRYVGWFYYEVLLLSVRHISQTVRHVDMLDGVTITESKAQKDELILEGNDIQNVSQSGAFVGYERVA
jgi:ribosomal protein L6P/L9E